VGKSWAENATTSFVMRFCGSETPHWMAFKIPDDGKRFFILVKPGCERPMKGRLSFIIYI
jgi:hypothetical protein